MHNTSNGTNEVYDVAVLGAGPAGLAIIAELLRQSSSKPLSLAWIDDDFTGGRLQKYGKVPSNTKAKLFVKYGEFVRSAIKGVDSREEGPAMKRLREIEGDSHCQLQLAANLVIELINLVIESGLVTSIIRDHVDILDVSGRSERLIKISLSSGVVVSARSVILATGCQPRSFSANHPNSIDLDDALDPHKLASLVSPQNDHIYVFGNSHSAALVMRNLAELNVKFTCVHKREPLYAIYQPESAQIIYDNTGLKGVAAEWMQDNWDHIDKILLHDLKEVPGECKQIYAIGFDKCASLSVKIRGEMVSLSRLERSPASTPALFVDGHTIIDGLYGAGIAFPGTDKYQHGGKLIMEHSVGMYKFCRHAVSDVKSILADHASE
jgi:hypothetical protein